MAFPGIQPAHQANDRPAIRDSEASSRRRSAVPVLEAFDLDSIWDEHDLRGRNTLLNACVQRAPAEHDQCADPTRQPELKAIESPCRA